MLSPKWLDSTTIYYTYPLSTIHQYFFKSAITYRHQWSMRLISFIYIQTQWEDSQCCASVTRYCYFAANYGAGQGRLHQTLPPVEPVECDQSYQNKNRNLIESRMCESTASCPASTLHARCESELRRGRVFRPLRILPSTRPLTFVTFV